MASDVVKRHQKIGENPSIGSEVRAKRMERPFFVPNLRAWPFFENLTPPSYSPCVVLSDYQV